MMGSSKMCNFGVILAVLVVVLSTTLCSAYKITPIIPKEKNLRYPATLGEGPHWDAEKQMLYFVDIEQRTVYRYDPVTEEFFTVTVDGRVTPVIPVSGHDGTFVVGIELSLNYMDWDGVSATPSDVRKIGDLPETGNHRLNDGKCDPAGRLWAGTMDESGQQQGNLYRLDHDESIQGFVSGIATSNGMAWSPDDSIVYYIDTPTNQVDAFNYDILTGEITDRRKVFNFPENGIYTGSPDGMTVDSEGNLWVCMWGGSAIHRINPTNGTLLKTLDFTGLASAITSAAFSGPDLDYLLVTSSIYGDGSNAGHLFKVTDLDGAKGRAGGGVAYVHEH